MQAVVADRYGPPEVLELRDVPDPRPGPDDVVVRVEAAGTNPVDAICRAGGAPDWFDEGPYVRGWDFAGVVVAPDAAGRWRAGDPVFGMPRFPGLARAYAELIAAPADQIAAAPASVPAAVAAALPLSGLTALQIVDRCDVRPGQRVLVNGAAGGVGQPAVALCAERGAHVIAVARAAQREMLLARGASEVVDHTAESVAATRRDCDVVIDCVGDDTLLACVRAGGVIAPVPGGAGGPGDLEKAADAVRAIRHVVTPDAVGLGRLAYLVDSGRLTVAEPVTRPLRDAVAVHRDLDRGHNAARTVLIPADGAR